MVSDIRRIKMKKWFDKAEREEDIFDKFIYGWLALVIAASIECTLSGTPDQEINDRMRVIHYFKRHPEEVEAAVRAHNTSSVTLSKRMGPRGGVILDAPTIQKHCKNFRKKVLNQGPCSPDEFAEAAAEIFNKVRNNLFHGSKLYDDTEDRKLLELVTPLLLTFVATVESLSRQPQTGDIPRA